MAMVAGSVSVADDETHTGSGLALARYEADKASRIAAGQLPAVPTLGSTALPWSASRPVQASDIATVKAGRLAILREAARLATAYASADVAYWQANAKAHVTTESLGRTPNPNSVDTAIQAPASPVDIPIT